jgi:DNA-binding transcriptional regulator GbsR (MarR family)
MPKIPKKSNEGLTLTQQRFIEDVARLMVPWGVPPAAARLNGYLLLFPEPVSLDRITADLGMSKSSASVAARLLEKYRLALRHGERGSKRVLYEVSRDYDGMLIEQNRLLDGLAELLKNGARSAASRDVQDRLKEMAEFYLTIRQSMDAALRRWRTNRLG